ncbi:MAG TPA: sigma-70 family RNA polymerase sigma factor [Pseudonocardiaceae bacterium]|nr:sigma-70 family RNA polymerase sigma factor [Pseudonocardiaceae bacterium]
MDPNNSLTSRFETQRGHLRAVAYRMLGSLAEADDAVQEAWLRLDRADTSEVRNLDGWLTTVVARVSLDMLRSRGARREEPLDVHVPDPIIGRLDVTAPDPEQQTVLADSVGLALLVVLDTLAPAERLAFVLHDMFAVPFDDIAPIVGRTPTAARQLASRARRRVRGQAPVPETDLARQREVVDAFMAASRDGDFDALLAVLDPDVVLRANEAEGSRIIRGARAVAGNALAYRRFADPTWFARLALVNGGLGIVTTRDGRPVAVLGLTIAHGRIVEMDILADPERLRHLDLTILDG